MYSCGHVAAEVVPAVPPVVVRPIENPDLVPVFSKPLRERRADGSQAARDENLHSHVSPG